MRSLLVWFSVGLLGTALMPAPAGAQDPLDRDSWNVSEGDWGDDDNWVDDTGALSGTPTLDDDRWALVSRGVATVSGDHQTSGLTIQNGTVEILPGASLEVALQDNPFSVGQTEVAPGGTLRILGDGSYKALDANILGTIEMAQAGSFESSGDANLQGTYRFEVTSAGNPALQIGGEATIGGTVAPTFTDTNPGFGDTITFVEAGTVKLSNPSLELPASVSLPRGLLANLVAEEGRASITITNLPILQVDRGTADAKIMNVVGGPIEMTGYVIESELGTLQSDNFSGFGGPGWDRPNPLNTTIAEFSLTETESVGVGESLDIGKIYNGGATIPEDEDVAFRFFRPDGEIVEGLVEYVGPANDLVLNANPETGEVTIQHLSPFIDPIEVTGYSVASASGSLEVDAWNSLEDAGAAGWLETNPTPGLIAELNLSDSTIFNNGMVLSLGNIFDVENGIRDLVLRYTTTTELLDATVEYQLTMSGPGGIAGDIDGDGTVAFSDFLILSSNFGMAGTAAEGDIDGDGQVGFPDFLTLSANFGQSAAAVAIPEPSSLTALGLGSLLMLASRRRRKATRRTMVMQEKVSNRHMSASRKALAWSLARIPFLVLLSVASTRTYAVENFTVSNWGDGSQIWWEAEYFDERIPDTDDHFALASAPDGEEAFGPDELNTINRIGGGGRISYDFDINQIGEAGTWYFWGRVLNPGNLSDFMLVEGHPGDVIPTEEPFSGSFSNDQRVFERNTGPPFDWSGGGEGHIKQLQDGENTMHIVHRQAASSVFWDVMMWTDDPNYVPTDADYLDSEPLVLIENPGDFNEDGAIDLADYQILLENFNTPVDRGMDGDITFSGHVDYRDFVQFRSAFEAQAGAATAAVPEPASLFLLGVGALLLDGLRRRRCSAGPYPRRATAWGSVRVLSGLLVAALAGPVATTQCLAQLVVVQEPGTDYLAFEAEDFFDLNNADDATGWGRVGINSFVTQPPASSGSVVLAEDTGASRNAAVFDFPGGNDQDFVRYRLQFVEDGEYSLYLRYSMFDIQGDAAYGNEDSIYISSDFGVDGELIDTPADPRGNIDGASYYSGGFPKGVQRQEGNFDWWNAEATDEDTTADNPDGVYFPIVDTELDFGIAARERGVAIDRIVFHTDAGLSAAELDALPSYDPFTVGILPGDFNRDGTVDFADFTILRENFGSTFDFAESHDHGDGTRDGTVDLADFLEFRQIFNAPAGASAVPEPLAPGIILSGLITISWWRRRNRPNGRGNLIRPPNI